MITEFIGTTDEFKAFYEEQQAMRKSETEEELFDAQDDLFAFSCPYCNGGGDVVVPTSHAGTVLEGGGRLYMAYCRNCKASGPWRRSKTAAASSWAVFFRPLEPEPPKESISQEAHRLVNGPRRGDYGHPLDDYTRTGRIWGAILGLPDIPAETCCLMMVAVKISREVNHPKRDNRTDGIGYFECEDLCIAERARREGK